MVKIVPIFGGCLGRRAFLLLSDRYKYSGRFCLKSENNYVNKQNGL